MKLSHSILLLSISAAIVPVANAEIAIDEIGGVKIGFEGLVQTDANWFYNDVVDLKGRGANGNSNEFELRRAELVLKGQGPGNFNWVLGYDAKADRFLDVNVRYRFSGDLNQFLHVGQFKQFNSLDELSSAAHGDFISKATVTNVYGVSRRLAVGYGVNTQQFGAYASYFGRELTRNLANGNGYSMRGTWSPINEEGQILHLGLAYASHRAKDDTYRARARPNADLATVRLVDAGLMTDVDRVSMTSFETMWVNGPVKLQGEYFRGRIGRDAHSTFNSSGYYLSGLWNVTGETWGYKNGVPVTSSPDDPMRGMWQLGLRYDNLNLNDGAVQGGKMGIWTAGANWYWRSNYKVALNYVMVNSKRAGINDDPNILEARLQFYW
ncbi:MAG: OprO/OprP family phosphate-selective porin [Xanthomonadaceae bacterium]|jgi:phosphate-selective porin OprO/OprP|nr:OprO/OprP family phosphate-selective porin [Xanthomonadaceae bacterium]